MYLLKLLPLLGMGEALDTTALEMVQAGREIENYCQQFNDCFHGGQIENNEINEVVKKLKLEIVKKSSGGLISKKELAILKNQANVRLTFGCNLITFPIRDLTNQLSPIEMASIFQLPSISQCDRWSCGCWATFNAASIRDILRQPRLLLTSVGIQKSAQKYCDDIGGLDSCVDYVIEHFNEGGHNQSSMAEVERPRVGITFLDRHLFTLLQNELFRFHNDTFILVQTFGSLWPAEVLFNEQFDQDQVNQINAQKDALFQHWGQLVNGWVQNNQVGLLNFICRVQWPRDDGQPNERGTVETVSHWILISLVKLRNRNPVILILDSANSLIGSCGTSKHDITPIDYLLHLHQQLVAPYIRIPQEGKKDKKK